MATYYPQDDFSNATFDDILINGYGERSRIIAETPRRNGWIVQSELHDNIRRVVLKDTSQHRSQRLTSEN